jgi:hypothetical protein
MRRPLALLCLPLCALAACGTASTTSTSAFTGVKREVAQAIANLQSNASSAEQSKICANDLAAGLVRRLGGTKGCEAAIKAQLNQVDNPQLSIESVHLPARPGSASATVISIHEGMSRPSTIVLVKEGGAWKISRL